MPASDSGLPSLRADAMTLPHPRRFSPERPDFELCMAAHAVALAADDMGYMDPTTGLFVMTAAHLAERPCCARGCRHCPWVGASE